MAIYPSLTLLTPCICGTQSWRWRCVRWQQHCQYPTAAFYRPFARSLVPANVSYTRAAQGLAVLIAGVGGLAAIGGGGDDDDDDDDDDDKSSGGGGYKQPLLLDGARARVRGSVGDISGSVQTARANKNNTSKANFLFGVVRLLS